MSPDCVDAFPDPFRSPATCVSGRADTLGFDRRHASGDLGAVLALARSETFPRLSIFALLLLPSRACILAMVRVGRAGKNRPGSFNKFEMMPGRWWGPCLDCTKRPDMPSRRPAGLLLGRDKRRLVRQALDRSLLRSLIQLTGQCHAGETLGSMSAITLMLTARTTLFIPLRATCRGRVSSTATHSQRIRRPGILSPDVIQAATGSKSATASAGFPA